MATSLGPTSFNVGKYLDCGPDFRPCLWDALVTGTESPYIFAFDNLGGDVRAFGDQSSNCPTESDDASAPPVAT